MTTLPPLFVMNDLLCGMVLKRVTSKKIFKKWNRCVFVAKPSFLQLYRTAQDFKAQGPLYWQTNIHSYMVPPIDLLKRSTQRPSFVKHTTTSSSTPLNSWKTPEPMSTRTPRSRESLSTFPFQVQDSEWDHLQFVKLPRLDPRTTELSAIFARNSKNSSD